jgi:hypothetical protein
MLAPALAQDCDANALENDLKAASPAATANAYVALASCDPATAKENTQPTFERILSGQDANRAVTAAIEVGAGDIARTWIGALQSDERSSAIAALGHACADSTAVSGWLVQTQAVLGDRFWSERWYRSLAECRSEGIQALLTQEVENPAAERSRFTGVLEVYARNLGITSIPRLGTLATELDDPQEVGLVINVFGDAAGLGSREGASPEATALAVKILVEIAPELPSKINDQVRTVLLALGAQQESDHLAAVRYAAQVQPDGNLHYGLVAVSTQSCKKGTTLVVHSAEIVQPGTLWPDQLEEPVRTAMAENWEMGPGKRCTVEGELEVFMTKSPVADAAAVESYQAEITEELAKRGATKRDSQPHPALSIQ